MTADLSSVADIGAISVAYPRWFTSGLSPVYQLYSRYRVQYCPGSYIYSDIYAVELGYTVLGFAVSSYTLLAYRFITGAFATMGSFTLALTGGRGITRLAINRQHNTISTT